MNNKNLLVILGHSCVGKSSVLKSINKQSQQTYYIVADKIKKYISNYENDNPVHLELKDTLVENTFKILVERNFSILFELSFSELRNFDKFHRLAHNSEYQVFIYEFVAPKETLIERFQKRLSEGGAKGARFVTTTEEAYWSNYASNAILIEEFKNRFPITECIDTSRLSTEEITIKLKPLPGAFV